jgi:hypothetical protein
MTLEEELDIAVKSVRLKEAGKVAEADQLIHQLPVSPRMAQFAKKYFGVDFLINGGWNLAEADHEFGPGWLTR